jgi:DNA-binding CsgD family transcriptional regulator
MVGVFRITPDGPYTHTPLPLDDQVAYVRHYARLDPAAAPQVAGRLEIAHRWSLVPRDAVRGTEFHEEWLRPRRLEDALWLNTFDGASLRHRVFLSFDRVLPDDQRARMETLLRLVAPAFRAGTAALDRHGSELPALLRTLDALPHGAAVHDAAGTLVHRTPALGRLLAADPERARVEQALGTVARAVGTLAHGRRALGAAAPPGAAEQRVATAAATYTVRATLLPDDAARILVELVPAVGPSRHPSPVAATPTAEAASDAALRARFGLTAQECQVARHMAARRTDAEIGAALGISPNTARTHAERVRRKLGVARRGGIAAVIA